MLIRFSLIAIALLCSPPLLAHDTWVETNTNLIRTGDAVYIDLKLGNHGNHHRDFKIASKIDPSDCTLNVIDPDGKKYDIKQTLVDIGYTPNEGYWTGRFVAVKPGMYVVAHTLDKVVNHGHPVRSIKSGKTFFVASPTLDRVSPENPGFDRVLEHPLELVPVANPVTPMGPGQEIKLQALYKGKPLQDATVSFVPRGEELKEGFDEQFERKSDEQGIVSYTPKMGNHYLAVVHQRADDEKTEEYDYTTYSATLTIFVPELCPCCGE